jgi:hypothetical protein
MALRIAGISSPSRSGDEVDIDSMRSASRSIGMACTASTLMISRLTNGAPAKKRAVVAFRALAAPALAHGGEGFEPGIAAVCRGRGVAEEKRPVWRQNPIEGLRRGSGVKPMEGAADRNDIKHAEARGRVFETAFDQPQCNARVFRRRSGLLDHRGLGIDADQFAAPRGKADRQKSRPRADVEEPLAAVEVEPPGDCGKEPRVIGRPGILVIGDGRSKASHGDSRGWRELNTRRRPAL